MKQFDPVHLLESGIDHDRIHSSFLFSLRSESVQSLQVSGKIVKECRNQRISMIGFKECVGSPEPVESVVIDSLLCPGSGS